MINNFLAFAPSLIPPYPTKAGLRIFVGSGVGFGTGPIAGYVVVGNSLVAVPADYVNVTPLSITYVYLDMATGTVRSNNSGFTGNIYPIAVVITNDTEITSLIDSRPDITTSSGGGGGGSFTDTVQAFTASGTVSIAAGQNLFGTCIGTSTLSLISPVGLAGQYIKLIKIDNSGMNTISGGIGGNYFLTNFYQYVIFESDGVSWYVIGNN